MATKRAVSSLGGSAQAREITTRVIEDLGVTEEQLGVAYPNRPKSVLIDRIEWARSYAKMGGALDSPQRGLFVLSARGKELLTLPEREAVAAVRALDREVRAGQRKSTGTGTDVAPPENEVAAEGGSEGGDEGWTEALLARLHRLTPEGFEEFVMYLLRAFGLELTRVGGTGDKGIDGIGTAPLSPVLSSRVAVQAKRYDPTSTIARDVVALFQRDAGAAGAERAVLVALGRFSSSARAAAVATTPTVDLLDGQRICDLVRERAIGLRLRTVVEVNVEEEWFDRFDGGLPGAGQRTAR